MPIRFHCEHCEQRLSVSTRKAGAKAKCPKCKGPIRIPSADEPQPLPEDDDPLAQFAVFESANDWVYEDDPDDFIGRFDPTRVAVPRRIIYMQGALLGAVGIVCFVLGVMIGQLTSGRQTAQDHTPRACAVRGTVELDRGDKRLPDFGCVVIAVPQNRRPDRNSKVPIDALRPDSTPPDRNDPAVLAIRSLGGDYTRTDANGRFQLQLPDAGKYYLLFVSANAPRGNDALRKTDLMQIGSYFLYANELLGAQKYRWSRESVRRDREVNIVF